MAQGCGVIIFGLLASISPFPFDLLHLFFSFYCFYFVMVTLDRTIRLAIADSLPGDVQHQKGLRAAHALATFSWVGVPLVWVAAYCSAISHAAEETLYQVRWPRRQAGAQRWAGTESPPSAPTSALLRRTAHPPSPHSLTRCAQRHYGWIMSGGRNSGARRNLAVYIPADWPRAAPERQSLRAVDRACR